MVGVHICQGMMMPSNLATVGQMEGRQQRKAERKTTPIINKDVIEPLPQSRESSRGSEPSPDALPLKPLGVC